MSNWTVRGTHTGAVFDDLEPSVVNINGIAILRIRDGDRRTLGGPHCQEGLGLIR